MYSHVKPKYYHDLNGPYQTKNDFLSSEGLHLEGPFIAMDKRGAHNPSHIRNLKNGVRDLEAVYGKDFSSVAIVTLAPELDIRREVVKYLSGKGTY